MELVKKMQDRIRADYLEKYLATDWTEEEIVETARIIAGGAIKYGMIRIDNNRKIVFDMEEWLKLDGETGPYLQYVCARINSLVKKLSPQITEAPNWDELTHPVERELLVKLSQFNTIVEQCVRQWKTIHLCSYLFDLGKLYNHFYAECSVAQAATPTLKAARLNLSAATGQTIKKGLEILGIEVPKRM
jgi:arginyl-tRNA synthetase